MNEANISKPSQTDWKKLETMPDEEIGFSNLPEIPPELFARAVPRHGLKPAPKKEQLTIRVDRDVISWFKSQGRGYQTRMNALLRAYMEAHERRR